MRAFELTHVSDAALIRRLTELVIRDRVVTATLLAHIAEVDARRLYVPAGYPSMHAYCVDALHLSEGAAYKRIRAARAAREFPRLLPALAEGRLHLTAVYLLAPHLTPENVDELIASAEHRRKSEIDLLLAGRFPLAGGVTEMWTRSTVTPLPGSQLPPGAVQFETSGLPLELKPGPIESRPAGIELTPSPPPPRAYALRVAIDERTREKLQRAQALLSHAVPSGDIAQVLDRALDVLIERLEKRKFAATARPRAAQPPRASANVPRARTIPADVRRAVWERDQGQCTFVAETGRRCPARNLLEFDHVDPVARGGRASVDRMRLRCRAHNQYEAERAFGVEFMRRKRQAARTRAAAADQTRDVVSALRGLGLRAEEARRAAEFSQLPPNATLEDRVRAALRFHRPRHAYGVASGQAWARTPAHSP